MKIDEEMQKLANKLLSTQKYNITFSEMMLNTEKNAKFRIFFEPLGLYLPIISNQVCFVHSLTSNTGMDLLRGDGRESKLPISLCNSSVPNN